MTDVPFITDAVLTGAEGSQPAAGVVGRLYYANDNGICYRDNGSSWVKVLPRSLNTYDPSVGGAPGAAGYDILTRRFKNYDSFTIGSIPRTLSVQRSTTDTLDAAVITTTETAFATQYVLPANYFIAQKLLRLTVILEETSSGAPPTSIYKLRLQKTGPTNVNLYGLTATAVPAGKTSAGVAMSWMIQGTAAPGAAVSVECGLIGAPPIAFATLMNTITQPATVDTTAAQTIQVTLQFSANTAGNTAIIRQFILEELN